MKQTEILEWAISGVKFKHMALWDGYQTLKHTNPEAAEKVAKVSDETLAKLKELEELMIKAKEEEQ